MNTKRFLIAGVAVAVWLMLYGFVVYGILLADFWDSQGNAAMMRPENEQVMWAIMLSCLLQGLALAFIFTKGYEGKGVGEGVRFGLLVAWFIAGLYLLFYAIQPWGEVGLVASIATDGLMYVGAGIVLALLYRK